jgi:hypothetical protein
MYSNLLLYNINLPTIIHELWNHKTCYTETIILIQHPKSFLGVKTFHNCFKCPISFSYVMKKTTTWILILIGTYFVYLFAKWIRWILQVPLHHMNLTTSINIIPHVHCLYLQVTNGQMCLLFCHVWSWDRKTLEIWGSIHKA